MPPRPTRSPIPACASGLAISARKSCRARSRARRRLPPITRPKPTNGGRSSRRQASRPTRVATLCLIRHGGTHAMKFRTIVLGAGVVAVSFAGATLLMDLLWPSKPAQQGRPVLVAVPPLQPLTGTSTVLAPAAIALTAIRDALDTQAPRNLSGKPQNPVSKLLSSAQLNFNVARGPLSVAGQPGVLIVTTQLTGTFEALGTIAGGVGNGVSAVGGAIGNAIG